MTRRQTASGFTLTEVLLAMAIFALAIGIVIMVAWRILSPEPFFRWKTEIADPAVLDGPNAEVAGG